MLSSCVRSRRASRKPSVFFFASLLALLLTSPLTKAVATLPAPDVSVVDYKLVAKNPTSSKHPWAQYEYVYKIEVRNAGNTKLSRVVGVATTNHPQIEFVDPQVLVGTLQPNQTVLSSDTFTIKAHKYFDRRLDSKTYKNGHWSFEGGGKDPDDQHVPGADNGNPGQDIDAFYRFKLGQIFRWAFTYVPDADPPTVSNALPTGWSNQPRPIVSANYSDSESGVDAAAVRLSVDGVDVTASATISASNIQYQPVTALDDAVHAVQLTVPDQAGMYKLGIYPTPGLPRRSLGCL